ncbi:energy-coupling factor ABC transporter permease [Thermodesulfobacteriota bacterium]
MHMADALLSPIVGGTMWAVSGMTLIHCARKMQKNTSDRKIPLMGVMGAFIFAAQMINFTIPGTGSSGHLGGGIILAVLLGSHAAFLVMASILTVQALFFADGGLLALGCNMFNLGFFPCFIGYPYIYRPIADNLRSRGGIAAAAIASVILALQFGSLGVVLQTVASRVAELPFSTFFIVMQPIHLAIGLVEGIVTAVVINFITKVEPGILTDPSLNCKSTQSPFSKFLVFTLLAAFIIGGFLSWSASNNPDGLEWAIHKVTGAEDISDPDNSIHDLSAKIQETVSLLPDYNYKVGTPTASGTSLSGILGGILTLLLVLITGYLLRKRHRNGPKE